jgi:dihydroorotate dehydrogenase (fumarate)
MELSTNYMGLALRNPLIASASPLSRTVDGVRRLADAGVGAVVLYSLFEEQLRHEAALNAQLTDAGTESFAESLSYFPAATETEPGPHRYLSLLERAAAAVEVPVIASLNGVTPGGWTDYARAMQDAGAAAIELNIYYLPGDPHIAGRDVEQRHIDVLTRVKDAVSVPVAVKVGPYFSSTGEMALALDAAGADALVLFNRFLQPDINPDTLTVVPAVELSNPAEGRLSRTWIALLHGRVRAALAATTGVEDTADVARYLLAGTATPRPHLRDRPARRPDGVDGPQGIHFGRRVARDPRGGARHRRGSTRARRLRQRAPGSQQQHLRPLVTAKEAVAIPAEHLMVNPRTCRPLPVPDRSCATAISQ